MPDQNSDIYVSGMHMSELWITMHRYRGRGMWHQSQAMERLVSPLGPKGRVRPALEGHWRYQSLMNILNRTQERDAAGKCQDSGWHKLSSSSVK